MTKNLRRFAGVTLAVAAAAALSACSYDPYYSSTSVGYGYGDGYGYGSSSFSTTTFISTGDPRWGYDPHVRAYYDYTRRAYYDPYLYGYYPVGYRPVVVHAAPHPHGWRPGLRRIAPPRRITSVTLRNYRDRHDLYRRSNHSWARSVQHHRANDTRRDNRSRFERRDRSPSRPQFNQRDRNPSRPQFNPRDRDRTRAQFDSRTRDRSSRMDRGSNRTGVRERGDRSRQTWVNTAGRPEARTQSSPSLSSSTRVQRHQGREGFSGRRSERRENFRRGRTETEATQESPRRFRSR